MWPDPLARACAPGGKGGGETRVDSNTGQRGVLLGDKGDGRGSSP